MINLTNIPPKIQKKLIRWNEGRKKYFSVRLPKDVYLKYFVKGFREKKTATELIIETLEKQITES